MCTVTYIPPTVDYSFILTTNRDEKEYRRTEAPAIHERNGLSLCFPQDILAGGSWIAANGEGRLCCLLNGAFVAHQKQEFHTYSRGKVLLDFVSGKEEVSVLFEKEDFTNVEPFTIVTIEHDGGTIIQINECIWDGTRRHFRELDKRQAYIWSSVTLYSEESRNLRKEWFYKFLQEYRAQISPEKVFIFHSDTHTLDHSVNLIMHREGGLKTVSITQVTPHNDKLLMNYFDLVEDANHKIEI